MGLLSTSGNLLFEIINQAEILSREFLFFKTGSIFCTKLMTCTWNIALLRETPETTFQEVLRGCTFKIMQEKSRHLYFYHSLEKSSKIEELGARGSPGLEPFKVAAPIVPWKGVREKYLKVSVWERHHIYFQYWKKFREMNVASTTSFFQCFSFLGPPP